MKVSLSKKSLTEAIQIVQKAVPSRTPLPILNNILLEAKDGKIRLLGTDLELSIESIIDVTLNKEGSITIPARIFGDLVNNFPEGDITLEVSGKTNVLKIYSKNSSYVLNGMSSEEFPLISKEKYDISWVMEQQALKEMINKIIFAVAPPTESRIILTGILLKIESDKKFKMVSTDGHRLSLVTNSFKDLPQKEYSVVVMGRAMQELNRILSQTQEQIKMHLSENQAIFDLGNTLIFSRTLEGPFPPYEQVIPTQLERKWIVPTKEFLLALRRTAVVAREDTNVVKLKTNKDSLEISTQTQDVGQAYETIKIKKDGGDIEIAFNVNYLLDVVSHITEENIIISLGNEISPTLFKGENNEQYLSVVMPVRTT